jgi:large subunit ribosomal protein L18
MKTLKRRRRQSKTDYKKRIRFLKSKSPRLVFRKTNRYVIAQYIISKEAEDKVELGVNSKVLLRYGWPKELQGSLKSISASYLLGIIMGKKILKKGLKTPIIDFGLYRALHKSRLYAFVKGIVDSGLKVKCNEKTFPEEERVKGNKIPFEEIKSKIGTAKNAK